MNIFKKLLALLKRIFGGSDDNSDGNGTNPPLLGIQAFPYDDKQAIFNAIQPNVVRLAVVADENINHNCKIVNWYRNKGCSVILGMQDKHNPEATVDMAVTYASKLGNNNMVFELWNEPNFWNNVPDDEGWDNYLDVFRFINMLRRFRDKMVGYTLTYGGLAGNVDNTTTTGMSAMKYLEIMKDNQVEQIMDYHNFHIYNNSDKFYKLYKACKGLPLIVSEFGTDKGSEGDKITSHTKSMNQYTKNGVHTAVVYAWNGGDAFSLSNRPGVAEYVSKYKRR